MLLLIFRREIFCNGVNFLGYDVLVLMVCRREIKDDFIVLFINVFLVFIEFLFYIRYY